MDTFYYTESSSPTSFDPPSPSDPYQLTPMLTSSRRSSSKGGSSLLTPSSLSLQIHGNDGARAAGKPNSADADSRMLTPSLHTSLVSQILSLKREVETRHEIIEQLESALEAESSEKVALQEQLTTDGKELRAVNRKLQSVEDATILALEELCRERDAANEAAAGLQQRLDEKQWHLRTLQEEHRYAHEAWLSERQAWAEERQTLELRVTVADARLDNVLDEFARTQAYRSKVDPPTVDSLRQDCICDNADTYAFPLTSPARKKKGNSRKNEAANSDEFQTNTKAADFSLADELDAGSELDGSEADPFDLTDQSTRVGSAREVHFSPVGFEKNSLLGNASSKRQSLRLVESRQSSLDSERSATQGQQVATHTINGAVLDLPTAHDTDDSPSAEHSSSDSVTASSNTSYAHSYVDASCQTSMELSHTRTSTGIQTETRIDLRSARFAAQSLPSFLQSTTEADPVFSSSNPSLKNGLEIRPPVSAEDLQLHHRSNENWKLCSEEAGTSVQTDVGEQAGAEDLDKEHWSPSLGRFPVSDKHTTGSDAATLEASNDDVFGATLIPRARWLPQRAWRPRFVPSAPVLEEDQESPVAHPLFTTRALPTVVESQAQTSFERPLFGVKAHSFTAATVKPDSDSNHFTETIQLVSCPSTLSDAAPSLKSKKSGLVPPIAIPARHSSVTQFYHDNDGMPTPTRRSVISLSTQRANTATTTAAREKQLHQKHSAASIGYREKIELLGQRIQPISHAMTLTEPFDGAENKSFFGQHRRETSYSGSLATAAQDLAYVATTTTMAIPALPNTSVQYSAVEAISAAMAGEWMWKHARGRSTFGKMRDSKSDRGAVGGRPVKQQRWVWLNPLEKSVLWSNKRPVTGGDMSGKGGRKLLIQSVLDIHDTTSIPSSANNNHQPSHHNRSIVILTPSSGALKITATSPTRHYLWLTALSFITSHKSHEIAELGLLPLRSSLSISRRDDEGQRTYEAPPHGSPSRASSFTRGTISQIPSTRNNRPWNLLRRLSTSSDARPSSIISLPLPQPRPGTSSSSFRHSNSYTHNYDYNSDNEDEDGADNNQNNPAAAPTIRDNRSFGGASFSSSSVQAQAHTPWPTNQIRRFSSFKAPKFSFSAVSASGAGSTPTTSKPLPKTFRANSLPSHITNPLEHFPPPTTTRSYAYAQHTSSQTAENEEEDQDTENAPALPPVVPRLPNDLLTRHRTKTKPLRSFKSKTSLRAAYVNPNTNSNNNTGTRVSASAGAGATNSNTSWNGSRNSSTTYSRRRQRPSSSASASSSSYMANPFAFANRTGADLNSDGDGNIVEPRRGRRRWSFTSGNVNVNTCLPKSGGAFESLITDSPNSTYARAHKNVNANANNNATLSQNASSSPSLGLGLDPEPDPPTHLPPPHLPPPPPLLRPASLASHPAEPLPLITTTETETETETDMEKSNRGRSERGGEGAAKAELVPFNSNNNRKEAKEEEEKGKKEAGIVLDIDHDHDDDDYFYEVEHEHEHGAGGHDNHGDDDENNDDDDGDHHEDDDDDDAAPPAIRFRRS